MGSSDLNFRIVEKEVNLDSIYLEFKRDFLNPSVSVRELKNRFDLSKKDYDDLREKVLLETGLEKKPSVRSCNKIVSDSTYLQFNKRSNKFCIMKSINGSLKYFGSYDTKEKAVEMRDELIRNNWRR